MNLLKQLFGSRVIPVEQDDTLTKTGETVAERAFYHRRGELSPGEHALARTIRVKLERDGVIPKRSEESQ